MAVEILGDRWTLVVVRDIAFGDRRTFNELLNGSGEAIAPNILGDRLRTMVGHGLLTPQADPSHSQRVIYHLTEAAIGLVPVIVELGLWASSHATVDEALSARILHLRAGGVARVAAFQDELRHVHLERSCRVDVRAQPIGSALERAFVEAATSSA